MPELKWLKATKPFPYNGRDLKTGDYFRAAHFSDQELLVLVKQAVVVPDADVPKKAAPAVVAPPHQPAELAVHTSASVEDAPKELVENRTVETVHEPEAVPNAPEKEVAVPYLPDEPLSVEPVKPTEAEARLARKQAARQRTNS